MSPTRRVIATSVIAAAVGVLTADRPAVAQSVDEMCRALACSEGSRKCADVIATIRDERCEEGVMCCPFPEESLSFHCYESVT
jgi:hypothetical protein